MSDEIKESVKETVVKKLMKKGFCLNKMGSDGSMYLSKRVKSYSTIYAEVDEEGSVNGMTLEQYCNDMGVK